MKLKYLEMGNTYAYSPPDKLTGKVVFWSERGEVQLLLDQEACRRICAIMAEAVVRESRSVAEELTANIIESSNSLLENKDA